LNQNIHIFSKLTNLSNKIFKFMNKILLSFWVLILFTVRLNAQLAAACPTDDTPPADNCSDACIYCDFNGISSMTGGYTAGGAGGFCGTIENEQWLGFIAGANTGTFVATTSSCNTGNGIQIALYDACGAGAPVACYGGVAMGASTPATITAALVPGQTYFLMIDGYAGDQCAFDISVTPPAAVAAPPVGPSGNIRGPVNLCPGATVVYTIPNTIAGAAGYVWDGPPGSTINGHAPPWTIPSSQGGTTVTVTVGDEGGDLCVNGINACNEGPPKCKSINVEPIEPTPLMPKTICYEDAPFVTSWGESVYGTGDYEHTYDSWLGCDSLVTQMVEVLEPIVKELPPITLCKGSSIMVCGTTYSLEGSYEKTCQSDQGCDSLVVFDITVFDPIANIIGTGIISCNSSSVVLNSSPTTGIKKWVSGTGAFLGSGSSYTATIPGMYILQVTATAGTVTCTAADTVIVTANNSVPNVSAVGGTIGCSTPQVQLNGGSTTVGITYKWTGPSGYMSTLEDPIVTVAGTYTLIVTNPTNGCTASVTAIVTSNTTPPTVTATGGTLTCTNTTVLLVATSVAPNATFAWTGTGGFTSTLPNPQAPGAGTFTVVATNPTNGCTSSATVTVIGNTTPPTVSIAGGNVSCTAPNVTLNATTNAVGGTFAWAGPSGFTSSIEDPSVSVAGPYTLTVTGTNGCTATASITVSGNTNLPIATAVGGVISCTSNTVTLNGGSSVPSVNFAWTGTGGFTSSIPNPVISTAGTYNLTITNPSNSCTGTATATVTGNTTPPTVSATGGVITCSATSIIVNASSPEPSATFAWTGPGGFSSALPNPSITVGGTYMVIATNPTNSCTSTTSAVVSTNITPPVVTATSGSVSCASPNVTLNASSNAAGSTFAWTGTGGFVSAVEDPNATAAGSYTVVATATNGCTASATTTVTGDTNLPNVDATGGTLTCGVNTIILDGSSTTSGVSYSWTGPGGFNSLQENPPITTVGNYVLVVTALNQCTATATAAVDGNFTPPNASATGGTISCAASSVAITGNSTTPGATYEWNGPGSYVSAMPNVSVNTVGSYTLIVTGANGCSATATAVVASDPNVPNATANGGVIDCVTSSITISGGSTTAGTTFSWTGPGGFTSLASSTNVTTPGNYVLMVTNPSNGCSALATAVVSIDQVAPNVATTGGGITCTSPNFTISATSTTQNVTYDWSGPGTFTSSLQNPLVSTPGNYVVTVTSSNGCTSTETAVLSANTNIPIPTAVGGTLTCTTTSLNLAGGSNLPVSYAWTGPGTFTSTQQNPSITVAGDYDLVVTAPNGCSATIQTTVDSDKTPPGAVADGGTYGCTVNSVTLDGSSPTTGVTYSWSGPSNFFSALQNPTVFNAGTYQLVVTGTNGCKSTTTAQVIADNTPPTLVLATSGTLTCNDTTITINSTITTGVSALQSVAWTGPGGFTSIDEDPMVEVSGVYKLVATSENGCTSSKTINVNQNVTPPTATAVGGTLTCVVTSIALTGSSTTTGVNYTWNGPGGYTSLVQNPMITLDGQYTLIVTASNGCTSTALANVVVDGAFPNASIATTFDVLDCNNTATTLTGSSSATGVTYKWTGPGGLNSSNPIATNITLPGSYTLQVTAPNGCINSEAILISQDIVKPNISILGDTVDCITGQANLTGNSTNAGAMFLWSGPNGFSSLLKNPTTTQIGNYDLVVTGENGCTNSLTTLVAANTDAPVVTLAGGGTLTCGVLNRNIKATISTAGATGVWSGPNSFTSTSDSINVSLAGIYSFKVTALNGCLSVPTMTIDQNITPPGATATGGLITCTSPNIQLGLTTSSTTVSYLWSGPSAFSSTLKTPNVTTAGNYLVTVTDNNNGCTSTNSTIVTADVNLPTVTALGEVLTCKEPDFVTNVTASPAGLTFAWIGPGGFTSTLEEPTITNPGTYNVTASAANGCKTTFALTVTEDVASPGASAIGDTLTCTVPTGSIGANTVTSGVTYTWSGPGGFTSNLQNPAVTQIGSYTVVITAANGCTSTASALVSPDASIPQVTALGGILTCKVNEIQITATCTNPAVTWAWSGPGGFTSTSQNPVGLVQGNYNVVVTAPNGCSSSTGVQIGTDFIAPNVNIATPPQLGCTTTSINLSASVSTPGSYSYLWSSINGSIVSGSTGTTPIVSQAGQYAVVVTNNQNGCTAEEGVEVLVDGNTPNGGVLQARNVSCYGDTDGSIVVDSITGGAKPYLYSFDNQPFSSKKSQTSLPPGAHTLLVQDANGCEWGTTINILEPEQLLVYLGEDTTILLGQSIRLELGDFVNDPSRVIRTDIFPTSFDTLLCDTCANRIMPFNSLVYKVVVYDSNGCKAADDRLVIVDKTRHVYVPNAIDPNSTDNSFATVFGGIDVVGIKSFKVFDRWGESVHEYFDFAPGDPAAGWKGTVKGKPATPAVFVYYAEVLFVDGEIKLYRGDITVIRK
jgi:hypothetical protein